ncbi:MAG: hypothetical protein KF874_02300 [Rhizobiaceae bacterium]|nr:hypothetical protein [Rhizobiaceae bacterium]
MKRLLVPAAAAALLGFASISAHAGTWGATYPHGAHNEASSQFANKRMGINVSKPAASSAKKSNNAPKIILASSFGKPVGLPGKGGGNPGGPGVSHSAPGPVLGLGFPALAIAGGYVALRRRLKKK